MKIALIHYKLGDTDGVSLEVEKRAKILSELGHNVHYICGECPKDFRTKHKRNISIVPEMGLGKKQSIFIQYTSVKSKHKNLPEETLVQWFAIQEYKIYHKLIRVLKENEIDRVIVHNILSNPLIPPVANALVDALDKYELPTLCVSHDFYFERWGFLESPFKYIKKQMATLPPKRDFIIHNVINSIAQKELFERRKIKAEIIGDVWNFNEDPQKKDAYTKNFRKSFNIRPDDVIVLQATRVISRKGIQNAVLYCAELQKILRSKAPISIFGRNFNKDSRVVLFLSNSSDIENPRNKEYLHKVQELAKKLGVKIVKGFEMIETNRRLTDGSKKKIYSFWDAYLYADLVSYPSLQEGFGNQFLEALYYKKLVILFEYPVFKTDIKPDGYTYVSLGSKVSKNNGFNIVENKKVKKAAIQSVGLITDNEKLRKVVNENFSIANKHHGARILKSNLQKWLNNQQT